MKLILFFLFLTSLIADNHSIKKKVAQDNSYSIIYFYRIHSLAEPNRKFDVYLNDKMAFTLDRESRLEFKIYSIGKLKIHAELKKCTTSPIYLEIKRGEKYYIKLDGVACISLHRFDMDGERDYRRERNFTGEIIRLEENKENPYLKLPVLAEQIVSREIDTDQEIEITDASEYENRTALVIGNSSYEDTPLRNPANDADAIASELTNIGFDVLHHNNISKNEFREVIHAFGDKLNTNKGVGLFYYAGHGLQSDGVNYLVPVDAKIDRQYDIPDVCIRADLVLRMMELYKNPMNIIILDACRNNPYNRSFRSLDRGLAQPQSAPTGSIIAFATSPGKTASDGDGDHGLYTQELIKAMKIPGLSIEEVFKRVRINVAQLSNDEQIPWENSSLTGYFYFKK